MRIIKNDIPYEIIDVPQTMKVKFYTSFDTGSYVPNHWHRALEIIYMLEGELLVTVENKNSILKAGQCALINIDDIHSTKCTKPNTAIVLQIPIEFIEIYLPNIEQIVFVLKNDKTDNERNIKKLKEILQKMKEIVDAKFEGFLLVFNELLFKLLFHLFENFSIKIFKSNFKQKTNQLNRLDDILKYIEQNYTRTITLNEIAKVASFNPRSFCRFFKKHMGITFLQYQNELRLAYIYRDLFDTDDHLYEILERHGFANYKLFRHMFWQYFGDTPIKIRKRIKEQNKNANS